MKKILFWILILFLAFSSIYTVKGVYVFYKFVEIENAKQIQYVKAQAEENAKQAEAKKNMILAMTKKEFVQYGIANNWNKNLIHQIEYNNSYCHNSYCNDSYYEIINSVKQNGLEATQWAMTLDKATGYWTFWDIDWIACSYAAFGLETTKWALGQKEAKSGEDVFDIAKAKYYTAKSFN